MKDQQKQLITEIMSEDAKNGLYNKQTAVEWLIEMWDKNQRLLSPKQIIDKAKEMDKQQKKDAYKHGSDDENCRLSDGAMAPDYDNADQWYQGEYGGEQ